MKTRKVAPSSIYTDELLKLVFAEDQAALYAEGFVVLSCHPYVRRQMNFLQGETNDQLLSIVELFQIADPEMNQCAEKLEAAVADEMAAQINAGSIIGTTDDELVRAAERMQEYLLGRYRKVIELAISGGRSFDVARLEEISRVKQTRAKAIASSLASASREEGFSTAQRPFFSPRTFLKLSLR